MSDETEIEQPRDDAGRFASETVGLGAGGINGWTPPESFDETTTVRMP
jgi:hypothetical protein